MLRQRTRVSLGIACCRWAGNTPQILLINKRLTYSFVVFVHGKYNSRHDEIMRLFDGMTVEEKLDVRSLSFQQMWYRVWLDSTKCRSSYFLARNKFEATFLTDGGDKLRRMLSRSKCARLMWEIPKGRKTNKYESDIQCAVREFHEETGIDKAEYQIYPRVCSDTFMSDGVQYKNIWFIAHGPHVRAEIDFGLKDQIDEISDIRWMSIEQIREASSAGHLTAAAKSIFAAFRQCTGGA